MAKKILIVEDEKPMARAMELKLTKSGFTAQAVFNGQEALDILLKEKIDLVLLDLIMPKMDGFGLLDEIKKRNIKTKVIITSNLSQNEDVTRAKKLGAVDFIIKSDTSIIDIVNKVKKFIN